MPVDGTYQLFFLYSLQSEQDRLDFLQRTLGLAAVALVVLLGSMTWLVTRQTVRPVRRAAEVAERLADGHLSERMPEKGEDEMATLARSFNEMADSLQDQIHRMEELSTLQRRFVSDVSHELRTPLTTIRMAGEVIHASRDGLRPRREALGRAPADPARPVRGPAGGPAGDQPVRRGRRGARRRAAATCATSSIQAVDHAAPLAERRGAWLHVVVPEERCVADIDPRRVERILRNLLVNAVEHAEGSTVEVTVGADAHAVAVTVRDRGVGMTPDEAAHVFDRFWRADPARARTTGGTGLGPGDLARGRPPARRLARGVGPARSRRELPAHAPATCGDPADRVAAAAAARRVADHAVRCASSRARTTIPAALPGHGVGRPRARAVRRRAAGGPMIARRLRRHRRRPRHGRSSSRPAPRSRRPGRSRRATPRSPSRRRSTCSPRGRSRATPRPRSWTASSPRAPPASPTTSRPPGSTSRARPKASWDPSGRRPRLGPDRARARDDARPRSRSTSPSRPAWTRTGVYAEAPPDGRESVTFGMVQNDADEWRIAEPPPGLILQEEDFARLYRPASLYFLSPDQKFLVPEERWFPTKNLQHVRSSSSCSPGRRPGCRTRS